MSRQIKFIQGNEACVEGALYAGLDFFAGYPITPSSEIAELLALRLPASGGKFIQMEDEIASMGAVIGASLAGVKAMTATSGPGFSLMQEALGYAVMAEIPCVIVNVQRGGPSTGIPTHGSQGDVNQARWGTHGDHSIIALTASNHQDVFAIRVPVGVVATLAPDLVGQGQFDIRAIAVERDQHRLEDAGPTDPELVPPGCDEPPALGADGGRVDWEPRRPPDGAGPAPDLPLAGGAPLLELRNGVGIDRDKELVVRAELPGVEKDDVKVDVR